MFVRFRFLDAASADKLDLAYPAGRRAALMMNLSQFPLLPWKQIVLPFKRVLVAKTTQLGDLVISLPMAAALKQRDPSCTVIFLTSPKTIDVARCCPDIDEVYGEPATAEELRALLVSLEVDIFIQANNACTIAKAAHRAGVPIRIGSLFRLYNLRLCTHLVAQSRPYRGINKRLLDLQYLLPLGVKIEDSKAIADMYQIEPPQLSCDRSPLHPDHFAQGRRTIILSPSLITAKAHQWPLESYTRLIRSLDPGKFHWFICGVSSDRESLRQLLAQQWQGFNVTDLVGRLTLTEFMSFITCCDGMVAGSTGPLHLAAALGIHTLGIFQSRRSDIKRWHPLGRSASVIHSNIPCLGERKMAAGARNLPCPCIVAVDSDSVARQVLAWFEAPAEASGAVTGPGPIHAGGATSRTSWSDALACDGARRRETKALPK
jgi:ADP-heptose:LPS heptosyltransferase